MRRFIVLVLRWVLDRMTQPIERCEVLSKYTVTASVPQGILLFIQIGSHDGVNHYTWALIEQSYDGSAAFLWFIYTPEHERGKGRAKDLIGLLQGKFSTIETHYTTDIVNSAGTKLCMSCGFVPVKSLFKKMPHRLVWKKAE